MRLSWAQVYERLKKAPPGKLYGIPRGGAVIAGLTGRAVDDWRQADAIVDDIVDSGQTYLRSMEAYGKPFWALVDKRTETIEGWVVFPWEVNEIGTRTNSVQGTDIPGARPLGTA